MIKKFIKKQYILPIIVVAVVALVLPHQAHADGGLVGSFFDIAFSTVLKVFAGLTYLLLVASGWLMALSAILLNVGMYITTHLQMFLGTTGGVGGGVVIYKVWGIIRDISSLFLIFFILYAAIQIIISKEQANFGKLIKDIIIMGILINFSFFFARVMIDASNIVSLQFYKAISPNAATYDENTPLSTVISKMVTAGGDLSTIITTSIHVNQVWDITDTKKDPTASVSDIGSATSMVLSNIAGIIIQTMLAFSFAIAALAAIYRTAVLIFLLGFSAIWIAAMAIPQLSDASKMWWDQFKANLFFLPIYLLLMYVALRVVTESGFSTLLSNIKAGSGGSMDGIIQIFVGSAIIIFLINLPLFVAVSFAGKSMAWTDKWYKSARGSFTSWVGRDTVGKWSSALDKRLGNTKIFNSQIGRNIRSVTSGALATSKYGGTLNFDDAQKQRKDVAKKNKEIDRTNKFKSAISSGNVVNIRAAMKDMSEKEKLALGAKKLQEHAILASLSGSDYEAVKKSEDFSDKEKADISKARITALEKAVKDGDTETIKHMIDNMDGKDLLKLSPVTLGNDNVVKELKQSQLKKMEDEGLNDRVKRVIGDSIVRINGTDPHKSFGFINKNRTNWTSTPTP